MAFDIADQLRGYYSCRIRSFKWWQPMFFWIFDTAICNAYILHKEGLLDLQLTPLSHSGFMEKLVEQLLGKNTTGDRATASGVKRRRSADAALEWPPERLHGQHFIVPVDGSKAKHPPQDCVLCKESGKRSWSIHKCDTCLVGLHPQCFKSGISDFQWALLGMFQFCRHISLGFVLVLYVYNCNMSHSKLKPIHRLCPARLQVETTACKMPARADFDRRYFLRNCQLCTTENHTFYFS